MDMEKLEKLHELKEKGILSDEEFEKEKQKLLSDDETPQARMQNSEKRKTTNWKNVGISFLCVVLYIVIGSIIVNAAGEENYTYLINIFCGIVMAIIAKKLTPQKYNIPFARMYRSGSPFVVVFMFIFLLGPIGLWLVIYQFLQIKQGHAVLKGE